MSMQSATATVVRAQSFGLAVVLVLLATALTLVSGSHVDPMTGATVNNFLNAHTLLQMATDASTFAIMAVGATLMIISGGVDLSVGAVYAMSGVGMAMVLRGLGPMGTVPTLLVALGTCLLIALVCGLANGIMTVGLGVHSFIITLGTMWIFRGLAFVSSHAESILVPVSLTSIIKASLGLGNSLSPVPLLAMLGLTVVGALFLTRTVAGRHVLAVGGNAEASRFAGLRVKRIKLGVFVWSGLTAGFAAFLGAGYYGSATSSDGTGYELYVIASAVVGGASLQGGKGSAISSTLGALLIVLIRQAIRTLHLDQNYEWIIIGTAMIAAVVLDQSGSRLIAKRMARDPSLRSG
jgi:ribose transport system permease protein